MRKQDLICSNNNRKDNNNIEDTVSAIESDPGDDFEWIKSTDSDSDY